nr:thermonuclease family protein [uncultured Cohaesibacter sp.]
MRSYKSSSIDTVLNTVMWLSVAALVIVLAIALNGVATCKANAGEAPKVYSGPYVAYVTDDGVYDGDTINVEIHTAPGQILMTGLRVAGVDTPEIGHVSCEGEKALGLKAKAFVEQRYPVGLKFRVRDLQYDKYGGRHVAIVERETATGWQRLDDELLRARPRIADPYGINKPDDPLTKSKSWCGDK